MNKIAPQLARGALHITALYQGERQENTFYKPSVLLGRANGGGQPDFDLSPDVNVSRSHARIWIENGRCWIEDLGSKFGTKVDKEDIRSKGKVCIDAAVHVQVGDTVITVDRPLESAAGFPELQPQAASASTIEIDKTLDGSAGRFSVPRGDSLGAAERQALLLEILVQFSVPAPLDQLLKTIVGRVVELIPGAARGALLLRNPATDRFLMAAFVSTGQPAVSETLARRALKQEQAFIWRNNFATDYAISIHRHQIQSGMYAPLIYDGRPLGVLCVDNSNSYSAFSDDDLQLLVTVADHAAVAVSHYKLREELKEKSNFLDAVLANIPADIREQVLSKAKAPGALAA